MIKNPKNLYMDFDVHARIEKTHRPQLVIKEAVYTCNKCLTDKIIHRDILQDKTYYPPSCPKCGGHDMDLHLEHSKYVEVMEVEICTYGECEYISLLIISPDGFPPMLRNHDIQTVATLKPLIRNGHLDYYLVDDTRIRTAIEVEDTIEVEVTE